MGVAASRTTNPILLCLLVTVVGMVVAARRTDAPWAHGFRLYLTFGLVIITFRVVFRMFLEGQYGTHVLFRLPELPLPDAAAGIRIGGPVTLEGLLAAVYDGLRLAALVICVGAANVLADPKRLLRSMPGALYEVGTAITVALSLAPQLVESGRRVTRARRLRGEVGRRTQWFRHIAIPVMTDALDRSLLLAAAMDSRGYGRTVGLSAATRRLTAALVLGGLGGVCVGVYGTLDTTTPRALGLPMLAAGVAAAIGGLALGGRRIRRSRYRPPRWQWPDVAVACCGAVTAVGLGVAASVDPDALNPSVQPLVWPSLPTLPTLAILVGALAAVIAPPPRRSSGSSAA